MGWPILALQKSPLLPRPGIGSGRECSLAHGASSPLGLSGCTEEATLSPPEPQHGWLYGGVWLWRYTWWWIKYSSLGNHQKCEKTTGRRTAGRRTNGRRGRFPDNFVKEIKRETEPKDNNLPIKREGHGNVVSLVQRISTYGLPAGGIQPHPQTKTLKKSM